MNFFFSYLRCYLNWRSRIGFWVVSIFWRNLIVAFESNLAGIMFQDITTLLLDTKAFRDTIDLFVERYKDKNISVVAGIVSYFVYFFLIKKKFGILFFNFNHMIHILYIILSKPKIKNHILISSLKLEFWFIGLSKIFFGEN